MTTETRTAHTPTPWHVNRFNSAGGETWLSIGWTENGRRIGPVTEMCGEYVTDKPPAWVPVARMKYLAVSDEQQMANAEFIVRACNSHDALLAACKAALAWATGERMNPPLSANDYLAQLRAAIESAREGA